MSKLKTISALTFAAFALVGCKETGANESKPVVATTAITSKSNVMDCRAGDVRDFISDAFKEDPRYLAVYEELESNLAEVDVSDVESRQRQELQDFVNEHSSFANVTIDDFRNDAVFINKNYNVQSRACRDDGHKLLSDLGITLATNAGGVMDHFVSNGCDVGNSDVFEKFKDYPEMNAEVYSFVTNRHNDLVGLFHKRQDLVDQFNNLKNSHEIELSKLYRERLQEVRLILEELKISTNAIMVEKEDRNGTVLCRANVRLNLFENSDDLGTVNYIVEDLDGEKQVTILAEYY